MGGIQRSHTSHCFGFCDDQMTESKNEEECQVDKRETLFSAFRSVFREYLLNKRTLETFPASRLSRTREED